MVVSPLQHEIGWKNLSLIQAHYAQAFQNLCFLHSSAILNQSLGDLCGPFLCPQFWIEIWVTLEITAPFFQCKVGIQISCTNLSLIWVHCAKVGCLPGQLSQLKWTLLTSGQLSQLFWASLEKRLINLSVDEKKGRSHLHFFLQKLRRIMRSDFLRRGGGGITSEANRRFISRADQMKSTVSTFHSSGYPAKGSQKLCFLSSSTIVHWRARSPASKALRCYDSRDPRNLL